MTFLHVYHHANMLVYAWALLKFNAGGGPILLLWTNSFVHTIMYMYYLMTVWNKEFKSNFTWKKRITEVQLVWVPLILRKCCNNWFFYFAKIQFLSQFVYQSYSLAIGCIIPINLYYYTGPQTVIFSILFGHFYITHYLTKKSKRKVEECPSGKESSKIEWIWLLNVIKFVHIVLINVGIINLLYYFKLENIYLSKLFQTNWLFPFEFCDKFCRRIFRYLGKCGEIC